MSNERAEAGPADSGEPRKSKKKAAIVVTALLTASVAGVGLVGWAAGRRPGPPAASRATDATTVSVTRTDLSDTLSLNGTLGYGDAKPVKGAKDGLITQLPSMGTTVSRGKPLYEVNGVPVAVFYGVTPLFRTLDHMGMTGEDVKVVADNLTALGYDVGVQPAPGTLIAQNSGRSASDLPAAGAEPSASGARPSGSKPQPTPDAPPTQQASNPQTAPPPVRVRQGDGVLTASLIAAVKHWQDHVGIPATGVLGIGDVAVVPGPVRISAVQAQVGDPAAEPLMSVTSTSKTVSVPVDATDVNAINSGDRATVVLPDNSTTTATVAAISTSAATDPGSDAGGATDPGSAKVNVTLSLDDTAEVHRLNAAPVQVQFTTQTHKGVLVVPVSALLALSGGGYAVQLPGGHLIAIRTGLFSKGLVEISGTGIAPGLKVVASS
ncbi:hypothetical protein [Streptacidiphilus sp. EB129]|uniref:hypothetical protein n=1 Tax=Streptacidiphilus sp. EB129 TaxID=3156262 RepID=UPI003514B87E